MSTGEPLDPAWWHTADDIDPWDDLRFPAQSINPAGQTNGATVDDTESAFPGTLLFSHTAVNLVSGVVQIPHETKFDELKPHIHWAKSTSASGGVVWEFTYRVIGNVGGTAGDWTSADNGTLAVPHSDTANKHALTAFDAIDISGLRPSAMIAWRLYRKPGDELDTYGAAARLFELDFHYQRSAGKRGTLIEYPDID